MLPEQTRSSSPTRVPDRVRDRIITLRDALVRDGLDACRRAGVDAVFVLGHPAYYPRFGFAPAADFGLASEYDVPREAFMGLECRAGALTGVQGVACYHPAFAELG